MAEVERDYSATYGMFMKAAAIGVVGAIIYFFVLAIYLGGWSHTHSDDFVRDFMADGRIEMEYKGTKLPMFENPALAATTANSRPRNSSEPQPIKPVVAEAAPAVITEPTPVVVAEPATPSSPVSAPVTPPAEAPAHE